MTCYCFALPWEPHGTSQCLTLPCLCLPFPLLCTGRQVGGFVYLFWGAFYTAAQISWAQL